MLKMFSQELLESHQPELGPLWTPTCELVHLWRTSEQDGLNSGRPGLQNLQVVVLKPTRGELAGVFQIIGSSGILD